MPELPEVETIKRSLTPYVVGGTITGVQVFNPAVIISYKAEEFSHVLKGKKVLALDRRGKYLIFTLTDGYTLSWHLGMTGRLLWLNSQERIERHTHLILNFDSHGQLRFVDVRRFGRCYLAGKGSPAYPEGLARLGLEPLSPAFTPETLKEIIRSKKRSLKSLLLDQHHIAGLGNIYSDEALFGAGIHPLRPAYALSDEEIGRLYEAIVKVLQEGIASGGTSIRDYVDGTGRKGDYQNRLSVYGRKDQPCPRCGETIKSLKISGRTSYFCPRCQK